MGTIGEQEHTPKVSVIIPTYNRADYLPRAINSVLNQTVPVFEIIVVDDGSDDGTAELISKLFGDDPRVSFVRQQKSGAPAARNRGISQASGSLVAFQDSDDEWHPEFLEALLPMHVNPGVIAFCSMTSIQPSGAETVLFPDRIGHVEKTLVRFNCISTQTCLMDRELLRCAEFDVRLPRLQDWDLWLSLIDRASFVHVPRVLVTQYLQKDSMTLGSDTQLYTALRLITKKHWRTLARSPLMFVRFWFSARLKLILFR